MEYVDHAAGTGERAPLESRPGRDWGLPTRHQWFAARERHLFRLRLVRRLHHRLRVQALRNSQCAAPTRRSCSNRGAFLVFVPILFPTLRYEFGRRSKGLAHRTRQLSRVATRLGGAWPRCHFAATCPRKSPDTGGNQPEPHLSLAARTCWHSAHSVTRTDVRWVRLRGLGFADGVQLTLERDFTE